MKKIVVEKYNPDWKSWFEELKADIWPIVSSYAISIEHVGSTSIKNLAAKPKIDIDIVVEDTERSRECVKALGLSGYRHRGDLGIIGREAFSYETAKYPHNLYVCLKDSESLKNHITLRDHLKRNESDVIRYSSLKQNLANRYSEDIDAYVDGKTEFILSILSQYDFSSDSINSIKEANSKN